MTLTPGTRLGQYEILSPLGAGGMGEVYRARDTRLGREAAIKVLPEEVAGDSERLARFEREARALAALNHPGIVTIYSIEQSGETRYLAMELVEGKSLDKAMEPGGFPLARFFEIAVALVEALSAAHERGIVHRDLKPANVMITAEGRIKVLDFGLARLEAPDSDPNVTGVPTASRIELTAEGQIFGTVAYMSPEQARGGRVDARSDVFALGIVLYQMVTGARPFKGDSAMDLLTSILRDEPAPISDVRADVPPGLAAIIGRCLAKDPRDRYQTSRDLFRELRGLQTEAPPPPTVRLTPAAHDSGPVRAEEGFWIAVLPFKGRGDPAVEALAEGLTEDIVTGLSRFSYLRVIARSSTAHISGQGLDVRAAGKALGARYVMEGSLRQAGTRLRLAVQLIDTATGAHLWAENYERQFSPESAFELQDDLVPRIVSTVADQYGALVHSMSESLRGRSSGEYSAHEAVLRAFGYWERCTREEHEEVREILEAAVARAPGHSDCLAALSLIYEHEYIFGYNVKPDPMGRARRGATSGRLGADQPRGALRIGLHPVLPEGIPGFPRRGGASARPESHGFLHGGATRNDDRLYRRLGVRPEHRGASEAAQPASSGLVPLCRLYRGLPPARLSRRAGSRPEGQHARLLLATCAAGGGLRAARRSGTRERGVAGAARAAAGLQRDGPR